MGWWTYRVSITFNHHDSINTLIEGIEGNGVLTESSGTILAKSARAKIAKGHRPNVWISPRGGGRSIARADHVYLRTAAFRDEWTAYAISMQLVLVGGHSPPRVEDRRSEAKPREASEDWPDTWLLRNFLSRFRVFFSCSHLNDVEINALSVIRLPRLLQESSTSNEPTLPFPPRQTLLFLRLLILIDRLLQQKSALDLLLVLSRPSHNYT